MARFLELKKPWGDVITINVDHICYIIADKYSAAGEGIRDVVLINMLSGDSFTADIPYTEFMRLLDRIIKISLSGNDN